MDAFSLLPDPGEVLSIHATKSTVTAGDLTITWLPSLSAGAEDYAIYEGSIVSPWVYNHVPKVCTDSGIALTEEITPAATGVRYYLVVAMNPDLEGLVRAAFERSRATAGNRSLQVRAGIRLSVTGVRSCIATFSPSQEACPEWRGSVRIQFEAAIHHIVARGNERRLFDGGHWSAKNICAPYRFSEG